MPSFRSRKETASKASPLSRENISGLHVPHPFASSPGLRSGLLFSSVRPPSSPAPSDLCCYPSTIRQCHVGRQSQESSHSGVNPLGHASHTQARLLSRATGPRPGTGWESFIPRAASPLAHGAQPQSRSSRPLPVSLSRPPGSARRGWGNHWQRRCLPSGYAILAQHDADRAHLSCSPLPRC